MEEKNYRHYIKVDENGLILWGWSDNSTADPPDGVICINENGGKAFRLSAGGADNPTLCDRDNIPLYIWDGEQVVVRTEAEIEEARTHVFRLITWQNRYVLDADGILVNSVIGDLYRNEAGEEQYRPIEYKLSEGETTIPYDQRNLPKLRRNVDDTGLVRCKWTGTEWVEAATPEEIAVWEAEHPAPEQPAPTPSALDVLGGQVAQLALDGMQKNQIISTLGAELAQTKLDVMVMKQEGGV